MGNVVSSGENNNDLVDMLKVSGYIKTKEIERVFRAVDRGDYVLASHRDGAYKDLSWKIGNIHLSAPCVYSKVMEGLSLKPGLSFLNLGSGTGYLSTMAGLILNHHGTNHGIELNKDCLEYSYERLEEFKQKSLALDEFEFCEPVFMHGNCLRFIANRLYDRVYCGASCPESHEKFIKQFVKVGGILVMPYNDYLLRIERVDVNTWKHKAMLPVSFAALVVPKDDDQSVLQLPHAEPHSLQDLCRFKIRDELRKRVWTEYPELETKNSIAGYDKVNAQQSVQRCILPFYDRTETTSSDDNEDDMTYHPPLVLYVGDDSEPEMPASLDYGQIHGADDESSTNHANEPTINEDSPSTSQHNNVAIDSLTDKESCTSRLKKSVNINHQRGQSSSTNEDVSVQDRRVNHIFKKILCDDLMESESDTERLSSDTNVNHPPSEDNRMTEQGEAASSSKSGNNNGKRRLQALFDEREYLRGFTRGIHELAMELESDTNDSAEETSMENNSALPGALAETEPSMNESELGKAANEATTSQKSTRYHIETNNGKRRLRPLLEDDTSTSDSSSDEVECREYSSMWSIPEYTSGSGQSDITESDNRTRNLRSGQTFVHNVNTTVFSSHMRKKISQLPLPMSLRVYINLNQHL